MATNFSKETLNVIDWDGVGDIEIDDYGPQVTGLTYTSVSGTLNELFLPVVSATNRAENVEYPYLLTINDPNFVFDTVPVRIRQSLNDAATLYINGSQTQQTFTSSSGKLTCEF